VKNQMNQKAKTMKTKTNKMRTVLTLLLAVVCLMGYAQKKPKINKAESALEDGNYAEAKSIVDAAIEHEKTKDEPETWFVRAQVYAALDTANNQPGALEESMKAFDKTLELDPDQKKVNSVDFNTGAIVNVDSKRQGIYAYYYDKALKNYNNQNFSSAADNFETAFFIMPSDTNSILNAAYAALSADERDRAREDFNKAYEAGSRDKNIFLQLYNFSVQEKDFERALEVIKNGREAYPDDVDLMKYEINLYIQLGRTDEARTGLEEAIAAEPNNADLLFSLGVLKEETGDEEGAMESYKRALEVDPNHFNSNYNIAVSVFNEANEMMKERNALSYKEKQKTADLTKKINAQLKEALPLWEKLYSLDSTDPQILETLAFIYSNLKMNDKAEKISDELDALRGN